MGNQPSGEKTEKATPKKRREAREKGQIFKSVEVITAFSLLVMFGALSAFGGIVIDGIQELMRYFFSDKAMPDVVDAAAITSAMTMAVVSLLKIIAPILLAALLCGVVFNALQVGLSFSSQAMRPKLERISIMGGFKRIFSKRTLIDFVKSIIKIVILGVVAYNEYKQYMTQFPDLMGADIPSAVTAFVKMLFGAAFKMAVALAVFAPFDYMYQRWKHEKDMMMTKQEVRDEYKLTEGNPQIKSKISQKQRQISQMRMMQAVQDADVVITNPTHYAVALAYKENRNNAPLVAAKGKDHLAMRIKARAKEQEIAIVENRQLARSLYFFCDIGDEVPEDLYKAVAEVLAYVYQLKNQGGRY